MTRSRRPKLTRAFRRWSKDASAVEDIARNQQSELLIHGRNGQIRERDSFGNDPYPPKG